MEMKLLISLCLSFVCYVKSQTPTEDYSHYAALDPRNRVHLYWRFNDTFIDFEMQGYTTGWMGIGVSPSGGMANADIYVGWVKDGVAYLTDRHGADSNTFPPLDEKQNAELLGGVENNGWTIIKFKRPIAACDGPNDITITADTSKVIYALGSKDPAGDDIIQSDYHGGGSKNRGVRSLLILEGNGRSQIEPPAGETHLNVSLLNGNFSLPAVDTYYNCRLFELPVVSAKHHIVKIQPIIQVGNEANVHHILLYQCRQSVLQNGSHLGVNAQCYTRNMPPDYYSCELVIHAWAIGGGTFSYPNHAGYPIGEDDSPKYVIMETHYDNPLILSDVVDNSGLRITYTPQVRKYDAAILEVGYFVSPYEHIIPPNVEHFKTYGDCNKDCLSSSMNASNQDNIKVFGTLLHSHLLGQALTLRHIRDGVEYPPIARDLNYDFNYQETKLFSQEVNVRSGDELQLVCNYKSKGVRNNVTVGGLSTTREMCLSYLYYYPKTPLVTCFDRAWINSTYNYFGVEDFRFLGGGPYGGLEDVLVLAPPELAGKTMDQVLNSRTWNEETGNKFSEFLKTALRIPFYRATKTLDNIPRFYSPSPIHQPYVDPPPCAETSNKSALSNISYILLSTVFFHFLYFCEV